MGIFNTSENRAQLPELLALTSYAIFLFTDAVFIPHTDSYDFPVGKTFSQDTSTCQSLTKSVGCLYKSSPSIAT